MVIEGKADVSSGEKVWGFIDSSSSTECEDCSVNFVLISLSVVFQSAFENSLPALGKGGAQSCADSSRIAEDISGFVHFISMGRCR